MKNYVLRTTITSKGTEDREFTPYDDEDTALRKFHEAFNTIGGGSQRICAVLLDEYLNQIKREVWIAPEEEEAIEEG